MCGRGEEGRGSLDLPANGGEMRWEEEGKGRLRRAGERGGSG